MAFCTNVLFGYIFALDSAAKSVDHPGLPIASNSPPPSMFCVQPIALIVSLFVLFKNAVYKKEMRYQTLPVFNSAFIQC